MAKEVFVPTEEQLYEIQKLDGNVHKYLLTKVVETLCMTGTKYPCKGILKSAYSYLRENPYIPIAIGKMYPEEIKYSEMAQNDLDLCLYLFELEENKDIYKLDNLILFKNGAGILSNSRVIESTIQILSELLPQNPKYRFNYQCGNDLLDEIFSTKIIDRLHLYSNHLQNIQQQLGKIEPVYALLYDNYETEFSKKIWLKTFIDAYARTYGITSSIVGENDKNYLETKEAKQLIRCIKQNNK